MSHLSRIARAADWVAMHLDDDLSLRQLAEIANLSAYHFHRRFRETTGETPHDFVTRQRLERALFLLRYAPGMSMTSIALRCGFDSASSFSRSIRRAFGLTPSKLRSNGSVGDLFMHHHPVFAHKPLRTDSVAPPLDPVVAIEQWPAVDLAYARLTGIYPTPQALASPLAHLHEWARRNGIDPASSRSIGIHLDTPGIAPLARARYGVGMETAMRPSSREGVGWTHIPSHLWAVCRIHGDPLAVDCAWKYLFDVWLPKSDYLPAALPPLEVCDHVPDSIHHQCRGIPLACCIPITTW